MSKLATVVVSVGMALVILCPVILAGENYSAQSSPPAQVGLVLKQHFPNMILVQTKDLAVPSCKHQMTSSPGFVKADFNNDGVSDYAVLLLSNAPKRKEKWEGKDWPVHDVKLVVLMGGKSNAFDIKTLHTQEDSLPTIFGIQIQVQGTLKEVGTGRSVNLTTPGIKLFACDKFAVVYFLDDNQFRMVGIEG